MAVFSKNFNRCSIDISAQMAEVSKAFHENTLSFDETQERINQLYEEYLNDDQKASFKEILLQNHLAGEGYDYGFVYSQEDNSEVPQEQISLLSKDRPELFRYRDTAYNKIRGQFGHNIFKYLFVNQTPGVANPYPVTKSDLNRNIQKLKNQLCKDIVKALQLTDLENKEFFNTNGAVTEDGEFNYVRLMNHAGVGRFLNSSLDFTLDNPVDLTIQTNNAEKLRIIGNLFILNNFDALIEEELGTLLTFDPNFKGSINNTNYLGNIESNSTEYWADDSESAKDIRNYTSNLAKFIISQIPRVKRVGNNYAVQPDSYLSPNDLYVFGYVLKQAEYEYNLKHSQDPDFIPIIFALDTTVAMKKLLSQTDLPAIKNAKSEVLDSIRYFLYVGNKDTKSIESLYKANLPNNLNILDIEGIIAFEATQSYAPTYTEFDEDGIPEHKNYGGVYEQGNALKWNLTDFIFSQLKSDRKFIGKTNDTKSLTSKSKSIQTLLVQGLGFNPIYTDFIDNFANTHIQALRDLAESIQKSIHNTDRLKLAKKAIKEDDNITAYKQIEEEAKSIIKTLDKKFKSDYLTSVSERAIMQFDNNAGDSIPAYRLNSALTNDSWFIYQYNRSHQKGSNLLADNPILFSKYLSQSLDNNAATVNKYFKDSTSYLVDLGNSQSITGINELNPSDQLQVLFINNLIGFEQGILHCQPVAYSDKKSIGVKTINLLANFTDPLNPSQKITFAKILENYKINPEETIKKIREIDYHYRKNSQSSLINSILTKWYSLLIIEKDNLFRQLELSDNEELQKKIAELEQVIDQIKPLTDLKFNRIGNDLFNILESKFLTLDNYLKNLSEKDLRKYLWHASNNNIELVDEQDYIYSKGKVKGINQTILYDFQQLKDFNTFQNSQNESFNRLLNSNEYSDLIESIKDHVLDTDKDSKYYKLFVKPDSYSSSFFKINWIADEETKKKRPVVELIKTKEGNIPFNDTLKVFTAMSNLIRHNYMDLTSKFYYLDPAKGGFTTPLQERARRIDSMSKRMVLFPATIQQYAQGLLRGVSQQAKACVIEDYQEETFNISGNTHNQDIFDGSGYASPFWSIMENNSLPGHGIDGTKKTFGVSTDKDRSTLFKWAEYPLTNAAILSSMKVNPGKSFNLFKLFKKMHDLKWNEDIDLTKNLFGKTMRMPKGGPVYMVDGFTYKRIAGIQKTGINTYSISYMEVDQYGKDLQPLETKENVVIDSIFRLWEEMGGLQSQILINGQLQAGERSIEATADYIFNVGNIIDSKGSYTQNNVRQPLRNKFIAIAANKSAVKRGAANVNQKDFAFKTDQPLNYFTINTSNFGIQLDANHHADLSDVREMSQTISAMAALGYTSDLAEEIYQSLADLVRISMNKSKKFLTKLEAEGMDGALKQISERLIKKLAKDTKIASTEAFIEMFAEDLNTHMLPISDRRFYKSFIKDILEDLNKSSIRRRYTGLGGILNPASNVMQIYDVEDKPYLFGDLLKAARKWAAFNQNVSAYLTERWKQNNTDPQTKDIELVKMYLKRKSNIAPENLIEQFDQNIPTVEIISNVDQLKNIKILDTITYKMPESNDYITVTLDTLKDLQDFWKKVEQYTNPDGSITNLVIMINRDISHDLRPQYISWIVEYVDGIKRHKNIYATKAAYLSTQIGKVKQNEDTIETLISDLAEKGESIRKSC